jgi:anti-anti-sigma factor
VWILNEDYGPPDADVLGKNAMTAAYGNDWTDLKVSTKSAGAGIMQIDLAGLLDWANYRKVDDVLKRLFSDKNYRIIVNLDQVKTISTSGFGCFIAALHTAQKNKGNIIFIRIPKDLQEVFDILGLTKLLTFAETEKEAVEKLKAET